MNILQFSTESSIFFSAQIKIIYILVNTSVLAFPLLQWFDWFITNPTCSGDQSNLLRRSPPKRDHLQIHKTSKLRYNSIVLCPVYFSLSELPDFIIPIWQPVFLNDRYLPGNFEKRFQIYTRRIDRIRIRKYCIKLWRLKFVEKNHGL